MTNAWETLRGRLPDSARDTKLNLQSVLEESSLSPAQRLGVAIASAVAARSPELKEALVEKALAELPGEAEAVIDDAYAAAAMMAMNNVYYRFRQMVEKESYSQRSPRLRMNRLGQVKTKKADFELMSLAVSAINGCASCVKAHEKAVLDGGLTEDNVHDAVRIAATILSVAVALEISSGAI